MANIPGGGFRLPSCDPIRNMTIGTPEGRLLTDDWGSQFTIEGDIRLVALAVLKHATSPNVYGTLSSAYDPVLCKITSLTFSRYRFDFTKGIEISIIPNKESEDTILLLKEMQKILDLKAFF